ncbi:MAG: PHP domain-containing protein [Acetivibrionales bacterium]
MKEEHLCCIDGLNANSAQERLSSLKMLKAAVDAGEIERPEPGNDVNNHIHTIYSFSPYSPSKAIWMAYQAGLKTAGIMDHDTISGAREFIKAGKILGVATTIGVECRADFSDTPLRGKRLNNPDQVSNAYIAFHGIPHQKISDVEKFLRPYLDERIKRNILMVNKINETIKPFGITLDFEVDVKSLSMYAEGGSITERHILFAFSKKLVNKFGKGRRLVGFLKNSLELDLNPRIEKYLLDESNIYYEYDLLGALKSDMVKMFYIDARSECPGVREAIAFCREIGAISAYAYLGDVGDSVTGDKKAQKFEDDYLDLLFEVLKSLGFNAVTYMPSRNTTAQLKRVKALCEKHGLFQISGEDINSPRQPFVCPAMRDKEFADLIDSTWALVGHERAATENIANAMFSDEMIKKYPNLNERIKIYRELGMKSAVKA